MAIWLIRAGSHGEYEQKFIQENWGYVTWDDLDVDLAEFQRRVTPSFSLARGTRRSIAPLNALQAFSPVHSRLVVAEPSGRKCP